MKLIESTTFFYREGYRSFLIEGKVRDGRTLISIHAGYDERRGVFVRSFYTLPSFNEIAAVKFRFWDLAGVASMGWLFFEDVDLVAPSVHKITGIPYIILLSKPRRKITYDDLKADPALFHSE